MNGRRLYKEALVLILLHRSNKEEITSDGDEVSEEHVEQLCKG